MPANVTALPTAASPQEKAAQTAAAEAQKAKEAQVEFAAKEAAASRPAASQAEAPKAQPVQDPAKAKKTETVRKAAKDMTAKRKTAKRKPAAGKAAPARPAVKVAEKMAKAAPISAFSMPKIGDMGGMFPYMKSFNTNQTMETMMTQSTAQFDKMTQDAASMGRESMDAFMKSGTLFAKGMEEMGRMAMAMTQSAAEKQAEYAKTALSSKTINEFAEVQSKMAKASFDDFVQSVTKISEMGAKMMTEASEPLNAQMNKAMNKASKKAAA